MASTGTAASRKSLSGSASVTQMSTCRICGRPTIKDAPVSPWGNMDEEQIVQRVWGETLHRLHISDESTLREAADASRTSSRDCGMPL